MNVKNIIIILSFFVGSIAAQNIPLWKTDLGEPISDYKFINDGKYIFFTSAEYVWCYEAVSGKEVWQMEIEDFEEEGISFLLGELFLTNSDNKLQAYDALTGKLLWENEYDDIDQDEYTEIFSIKNNAVFRYGDNHIGIDLNNGKELFRMEIDWWGELVDLGSFNYSVLEQQNKMFVMEDETALLIDIATGKRLFENGNYDVNLDLIKNGLKWLYKTKDKNYLLAVLEGGAAVIDVENNKEIMRKEFSIDGDYNVILPTSDGCAIMGEDVFVHFNFQTGEVKEFEFPLDDIRSLKTYTVGGKSILLVSMADQLASIDLSAGTLLWRTKEEDPEFEGYVHRWLKSDGNNILLSYVRGRTSGDKSGSYIYLMGIDGITGKVKFKKNTILSKAHIPDFVRAIGKGISAIATGLMSVAGAGNAADQFANQTNDMLGYNKIGFTYETFEYGDNIIFFSGGTKGAGSEAEMWNTTTREEPGQGFASVNYKTGKLNYQTNFPITAGLNAQEIDMLPNLLHVDNIVYKAGNERVIKFNLDTGKKLWEVKIEDKVISETTPINGVLYLRIGIQSFNVSLKKDEIKVKEKIEEDPFGFIAIDDATGKILWEVETKTDPVLLTPKFNIPNYYNTKTEQLYFADLENLYALKMGKNGGKYAWKINFDDAGIGEFDFEETFAIIEKWIGSVPRSTSTTSYIGGGWSMTTTSTTGGYNSKSVAEFLDDASDASLTSTYTSWGNIWGVSAKKCLRILYGENRTVIFGPEKIALLNSKDGKIIWAKEWDYDNEEVSYVPKILNNKIVYCLDEELVVIDITSGKEIYRTEIEEKSKFFVAPNEKNIFNLYDEEIAGYPLNTK